MSIERRCPRGIIFWFKRVTSIAQESGRPVDMEMVQYSLIYRLGREMGFKMVEEEEAAPLVPT